MTEKPNDEKFEVTELDDGSLDDVAGGLLDKEINTNCGSATCNSVAGCGCGQN